MICQLPGMALQWRHNERDGVSNHQSHDCLLDRLFRRRSKKTPKFRVTGLCAGNSPVTGEFPAQMASNAENVSIWWRHHEWAHFLNSIISQFLFCFVLFLFFRIVERLVTYWEVSAQYSWYVTCQIWTWFKGSKSQFCKLKIIFDGEFSKRGLIPHSSGQFPINWNK